MRALLRSALVALSLSGAVSARAQTGAVALAPRDSSTVVAAPGATITTALRVTNRAASPASVVPRIVVPADWSVPLGTQSFALAAGETDSWIVSVRVPARAPAGRYVVAVSAADANGTPLVRDSIAVQVRTQRSLELSLTNRPTYAVSGESYRATFLLQNRGNVPTTVALAGVSATGGLVSLDTTRVTLAAGEAQSLVVRVVAILKGQEARDDVVELHAKDLADSTVSALASMRVTIVQQANATEPFHRVASQLRLRAADASAGVSPFELIGGGALRDGGTDQINFVMRGSAGAASSLGDRDEYRVELKGARYTARLGDALYRISSLTNAGQMGFGGGVDLTEGAFSAGGFAQRFRFQPDAPTERGAYLTARGADMFASPELTVSGVNRVGGFLAGRVLGTSATLRPVAGTVMELEVASSDGPRGRGTARTARMSGGDRLHFDLGHTFGDDNFAGAQHGARHDYASIAMRASNDWQLSATSGVHRTSLVTLGLLTPQRSRVTTLLVENSTRFSLQYSAVSRESDFGSARSNELQRGLLVRGEHTVGKTRLWGGAGGGMATSALEGRHAYHELTLGGTTYAAGSMLSLYGETSKGMSITRGGDHLLTVGGDARLQITDRTLLTVTGFQTTVLSGRDRYAQVDAGLSQQLPTGSTLSLRVRLAGNAYTSAGRQLAFLEYMMPLQLPVGRARTAGRVRGRVVNQETGQGVAGTLVRLGPQAAITDAEGRVAFAGLLAGQYRLSIAQQTSQSATVFTGDPTVIVDSTRRVPTTFALAVERAGIVAGTVRQMAVARTGLDTAPDSLAAAGPMDGMTLALVSPRDTLYASTDATGAFRFAEVPSGAWVLRMVSEPTTGARWEPAEIDADVKPGATRTISFRMVPRRRAVQMISGNTVIVAPPRK